MYVYLRLAQGIFYIFLGCARLTHLASIVPSPCYPPMTHLLHESGLIEMLAKGLGYRHRVRVCLGKSPVELSQYQAPPSAQK